MKTITRKSLDELARIMPVLSEREQRRYVAGDSPTQQITITLTRTEFGDDSTLSCYVASIGGITAPTGIVGNGYFLEPKYDEKLAGVGGSGVAIPVGAYTLSPGTYSGNSGQIYYYLQGDIGDRSAVLIHTGNTYKDTRGCLLPGQNYTKNPTTGDYQVQSSRKELDEINAIIEQYGYQNVKVVIK